MPLEFALRPRIHLERPAPRRRLGWLRLPPLAVPIAAYWLGMAGMTYALLRFTAVDTARAAEVRETSRSSEVVDAPPSDTPPIVNASSPAAAKSADTSPPLKQDFEPASMAAAPEEELPFERASEATARERAPAAHRALVSRDERSRDERSPVVQTERRALERPAPYEPVEEPPPRRSELPEPPPRQEPSRGDARTASLPSCESAAASANETIDLGAKRDAPDLTRDALASVLENGAYLGQCAIPARTALEICAAVRAGEVVGLSVTTAPRDPAISACVRRAVAALRFPRSSRLDVTRTRFEATP